MPLCPVLSDVTTFADPDLFMAEHVIDDFVQSCNPGRATEQSCMKAYGEHLGMGGAFLVEAVESVVDVGHELIASLVTFAASKAAVICVE